MRLGSMIAGGLYLAPRLPVLLARYPGLKDELVLHDQFHDMGPFEQPSLTRAVWDELPRLRRPVGRARAGNRRARPYLISNRHRQISKPDRATGIGAFNLAPRQAHFRRFVPVTCRTFQSAGRGWPAREGTAPIGCTQNAQVLR